MIFLIFILLLSLCLSQQIDPVISFPFIQTECMQGFEFSSSNLDLARSPMLTRCPSRVNASFPTAANGIVVNSTSVFALTATTNKTFDAFENTSGFSVEMWISYFDPTKETIFLFAKDEFSAKLFFDTVQINFRYKQGNTSRRGEAVFDRCGVFNQTGSIARKIPFLFTIGPFAHPELKLDGESCVYRGGTAILDIGSFMLTTALQLAKNFNGEINYVAIYNQPVNATIDRLLNSNPVLIDSWVDIPRGEVGVINFTSLNLFDEDGDAIKHIMIETTPNPPARLLYKNSSIVAPFMMTEGLELEFDPGPNPPYYVSGSCVSPMSSFLVRVSDSKCYHPSDHRVGPNCFLPRSANVFVCIKDTIRQQPTIFLEARTVISINLVTPHPILKFVSTNGSFGRITYNTYKPFSVNYTIDQTKPYFPNQQDVFQYWFEDQTTGPATNVSLLQIKRLSPLVGCDVCEFEGDENANLIPIKLFPSRNTTFDMILTQPASSGSLLYLHPNGSILLWSAPNSAIKSSYNLFFRPEPNSFTRIGKSINTQYKYKYTNAFGNGFNNCPISIHPGCPIMFQTTARNGSTLSETSLVTIHINSVPSSSSYLSHPEYTYLNPNQPTKFNQIRWIDNDNDIYYIGVRLSATAGGIYVNLPYCYFEEHPFVKLVDGACDPRNSIQCTLIKFFGVPTEVNKVLDAIEYIPDKSMTNKTVFRIHVDVLQEIPTSNFIATSTTPSEIDLYIDDTFNENTGASTLPTTVFIWLSAILTILLHCLCSCS